jgi:hypothetical protein
VRQILLLFLSARRALNGRSRYLPHVDINRK